MKYYIDSLSQKTAYLQLYEQMKIDIVAGNYTFGQKLPSKRLIAEETGVSVITVEHAYALLIEEGYVEARERSGYFVAFRATDYFSSTDAAPLTRMQGFVQCAGEKTEGIPFSILAKTMRRVISEFGEAILERSPNSGYGALRKAISGYLARSRGIKASEEQIIIGSGAEYLYGLVVELLGRDKMYAIEHPSYEKIEQVYRAADVRYECLPLASDGIDSVSLFESNAQVLHITPYRSFPSGITASASKRHEYVGWAAKDGRYIVEDDFESEFSISKKSEETLFSLSDNENVIYINTFSKSISPSFRVGYMVLPHNLLEKFTASLGFYSCTVPTFEQFVIAELITNGDFERHINRVRRRKRKELQKVQ